MQLRSAIFFVSLFVTIFFVTACNKKYSSDNPLPVSYYPSVILSSDNNLVYAINPQTGQKNWQFSTPTGAPNTNAAVPLKPSVLVYHNRAYVTTYSTDTIYKLNSETGAVVAKIVIANTGPGIVTMIATPIADANLLYVATTNDTLYAIDTGTGATKWKFGSTDNSAFLSSPVIYNTNIYQASAGGHVYCMSKTTGPDNSGNATWQYPGVDSTVTASFYSSPFISPPYLYIGSMSDSNMYCIYLNPPPVTGVTPTPGVLRWTYKTGGAILSSPTVYGGKCVFGSNDFNVYCLDTFLSSIIANKPNWKRYTNSNINSSPIISNQIVYIGSYDYYLYALNIIDGSVKWKFATKGLIKSSPLPYDGYVFVGSYDNYLYAVDSAFGTIKWSYYMGGNIQTSPVIDDLSGTKQINSNISGYVRNGSSY